MAELERIERNTPGTLRKQWYEDGVPADPGTVTVGIVRANGTVLVAAGTGTSGSGTNVRTYNLGTAQTALLDVLTVTWTSTNRGVLTSYVEVVGGFLFPLAELLADSEVTATAGEVAAARLMAEQAFEDACGVAFVPRYARETFDGTGGYDLMLRPVLRTVRAGSSDGTALTAAELADLEYERTGRLRAANRWGSGARLVLEYEHGYDFPPAEVSRAVKRLAKHYLTDWSADDRALRLDTEAGSYVMAVPGRGGSVFGIPEVDAVAQRYRMVSLA